MTGHRTTNYSPPSAPRVLPLAWQYSSSTATRLDTTGKICGEAKDEPECTALKRRRRYPEWVLAVAYRTQHHEPQQNKHAIDTCIYNEMCFELAKTNSAAWKRVSIVPSSWLGTIGCISAMLLLHDTTDAPQGYALLPPENSKFG